MVISCVGSNEIYYYTHQNNTCNMYIILCFAAQRPLAIVLIMVIDKNIYSRSFTINLNTY